MDKPLDMLMDEASILLVKMEYLEAQRLCEEALVRAKWAGDWGYVARILLPLQECRRQSRLIAVEGAVLIGSYGELGSPAQIVGRHQAGAVVLTGVHDVVFARAMKREAREAGRHWEVLLADASGPGAWKIKSLWGDEFQGLVEAPDAAWRNKWILPGDKTVKASADGMTPGSWVIRASEKLGDAGLVLVKKAHPEASLEKVKALESCLESVSDHEFLIQEYQKTARGLCAKG
jgi:hypothetical protein